MADLPNTYDEVFLVPKPPYTPTNEVRVCKGVCFEPNYSDTVLWADASAQLAYIVSHTFQRYENLTPFRLSEGAILVPGPADDYMECNYLAMMNNDFKQNKWYFAFINRVEFIDMYTSRIYFDIDVIQTYMFDIDLGIGTFVERAHSMTDKPGDNIVAENLELGDYIVNHTERISTLEDLSIVTAQSVEFNGEAAKGGFYNGIYSGLKYIDFTANASGAEQLSNNIKTLVNSNKGDALIAIWMMPSAFVSYDDTEVKSFTYVYDAPDRDALDGYTPKNKKLLTYPFKLLSVSNLSGQNAEYHFEYFGGDSDKSYTFTVIGDFSPTCTIKLYPNAYNGTEPAAGELETEAFDYGLTLSGFPQCAWTTDAYQAYLAQMGSINAFGMEFTGQDLMMGGQIAGGVVNLLSGNIGGAVSSVFGIAQSMAKINATKSLPPQAHGQAANGAMTAFKAKNFQFNDLSIRRSYARRIDRFFDMFGYQQNDVWAISKITISASPVNSRKNWNYIKTQNAMLQGEGNIPPASVEEIQNCFNNGIRFWHNPETFGDYSQDNSII